MVYNEMVLFATVIQSGSMSAAADSLGIPKSSVSQRMKRLEEKCGIKLLHRTTRQLTLTSAGQQFFEECAVVKAAADDALSRLLAGQEEPSGTLRISAPFGFTSGTLPRILHAFQQRYPRIQLDIHSSNDWVDMVRERIDVAIRVGPLRDSDLISQELGKISRTLVASPRYLQSAGTPRHPKDLESHRCITNVYARIWQFEDGKKSIDIQPSPSTIVSDNSLAYRLIAMGAGIGIVHDFQNTQWRGAQKLVPVLTDYPLVKRSLHLVYSDRELKSPNLRRFIEVTRSLLPA